jgi:RNA polymerase sigma-70 factor (ECF subfamily)
VTTPQTLDFMAAPLRALREEFFSLTEPHRPALWQFCLRLTGSPWDAEDLVQETMLRAFARLSNFWQPLADTRAYLFRIASNTWIDGLRRGAVALDALDEAREIVDGADPSLAAEVSEALSRLVVLLPPRQRVIVLLADVFDFTAREIGGMIGATEGAVRAALHRARETLRRGRELAAAPTAGNVAAPSAESLQVLAQFVEAFNRHDADAILALLDADASTEIVHIGEEHGREVIREQSLREGMASPLRQRAELGHLAGEPVVLVYADIPGQGDALIWMIRLGIVGGKVCTWRAYFFTPDLISYAADRIGVRAAPIGYRYVAPLQ